MLKKKKNLKECNCKNCTCDGACTCTDEHSCCGKGSHSHEVVREAKKKEKKFDLWETIYGELTDDGTQRINPVTGHPYINLGAGYNYQDQIGVDRDGNIIVKAATEEDLEAAKDIAEKYKRSEDEKIKGRVDHKTVVDKYDKKYPYHLIIKIDLDETLDESKLTEKRWAYTISDKVSKEFRDAIDADDEDYERVRDAIVAVYDEIHENTDLLSDDDYEDWVTEGIKIIDVDSEEDINFELDNLYDFCDNVGIFIGI